MSDSPHTEHPKTNMATERIRQTESVHRPTDYGVELISFKFSQLVLLFDASLITA